MIFLTCPKCNYNWKYKGGTRKGQYATCPACAKSFAMKQCVERGI